MLGAALDLGGGLLHGGVHVNNALLGDPEEGVQSIKNFSIEIRLARTLGGVKTASM